MAEVFYEGEPVMQLTKASKTEVKEMFKIFEFLTIDNGLSVVALDESTNMVVGCFTALDGEPKLGCCQGVSLIC